MSFLSKKECEGPIKCPVMTTLSVIGGKWKPGILWELQNNEILRFGQLKKRLGTITQKMLTQQLRELETDGIIIRKIYPEVPPRVEYCLSDYGKSLAPVLNEMANWGTGHLQAITSK
ncbi:helix-turn-helix domain-containing protein [Aquimarina sp. MMG015]|uniref:winged helix-turn-helix transcriptional regulator n=1 Tax=Aquimarina sp. MMG015 TaxID=2822689 RepID=UPI001FFCA033|nr:helix-turn-helix domain-containing protein [Aquimarina sp. MMG015]